MYEAFWVIFIIGLGLFCLTVILVRVWALKRKNYWKTQKMPYIESKIFLGTFASTFVLKKCITDACSKIYKRKEDHVIGKFIRNFTILCKINTNKYDRSKHFPQTSIDDQES